MIFILDQITHNTAAKSNNTGFFSRFIWPSFYLNINATSKNEYLQKLKPTAPDITDSESWRTGAKLPKIKKSNLSNKSGQTIVTNKLLPDSNLMNNTQEYKCLKQNSRNLSDQHWALVFILIIVIFAVLVAFIANSIYKSYLDVPQDDL